MNATKRIVRDADRLTSTQLGILNVLQSGPKSINEIATIVDRDYQTVWRPIKQLERSGWIEVDTASSAFQKENRYRLKRVPNSGITIITSQGEVSFNAFIKALSLLSEPPKIAIAWRNLMKAFTMLGIYAANELTEPGSVTESDLIEIRSDLTRYSEILQEQYGLVGQLLNDERFWDPNLLKSGVMLKTDYALSPAEMRDIARTLASKFLVAPTNSTNNDELEEVEIHPNLSQGQMAS